MSQRIELTVAVVTLGCARNEVDSEELAATLAVGGWRLADAEDADTADIVLVNTCGFIDSAKKDSIDTVIAAADGGQRVVAVGCLAERYGAELAAELPEAAAVLGFDEYPEMAARLDDVLAGRSVESHIPRDRRQLLPISPVKRVAAASLSTVVVPGHSWGPAVARHRLAGGPAAYLKLASGCDRRCTFCAIPTFRGAFLSRSPDDVLAEAHWLAEQDVRELVLVSENSTSYGKDLGDLRALEKLLPRLSAVDGISRIRIAYLQPAELRPSLIETMLSTPAVAPYFDLSFQHAAEPVLRRMKRFGSAESFLHLLSTIRAINPAVGVRSNFIVGFPGETEADLETLEYFLSEAGLDVAGVFGYSDEAGTEAQTYGDKHPPDDISARVDRLASLVDILGSERAQQRIGETVEVLVESVEDGVVIGRAAHQGPDTDGVVTVVGNLRPAVGDYVHATVIDTDGIDLIAAAAGDRSL